MLMNAMMLFLERLNYTREDGKWKAEFHGPFEVVVTADTLERCRRNAQDALDDAIAALIGATPVPSAPRE
jgi:predicted RNase H-like HicB family nuclease